MKQTHERTVVTLEEVQAALAGASSVAQAAGALGVSRHALAHVCVLLGLRSGTKRPRNGKRVTAPMTPEQLQQLAPQFTSIRELAAAIGYGHSTVADTFAMFGWATPRQTRSAYPERAAPLRIVRAPGTRAPMQPRRGAHDPFGLTLARSA